VTTRLELRDPVLAIVGLGANLGNAAQQVLQAAQALARSPGCDALRLSPLYLTAPHEATGPDYVNAVAAVHSRWSAPALLDMLQDLETMAGRQRPYVNAPRTLDLDLLFYGDARIDSPRLQIPHPRWSQRAFVLHPLRDLCPQRVSDALLDSVADQPIQQLLLP
jgi:2-amino-4-hydroxy-6-hydroxymethyldihydropteridine diphosphokinase